MKKMISMVLIAVVLALGSLGCATVSDDDHGQSHQGHSSGGGCH